MVKAKRQSEEEENSGRNPSLGTTVDRFDPSFGDVVGVAQIQCKVGWSFPPSSGPKYEQIHAERYD
jgi:hypothetical protein